MYKNNLNIIPIKIKKPIIVEHTFTDHSSKYSWKYEDKTNFQNNWLFNKVNLTFRKSTKKENDS